MAKTPESIGKYRVFKQLARGGMGAVYTAEHPTLDRTVIIKKLTLRGNADMRERFRREAQIMMDLRNDAIVDVYDHFREGTSYYIVLEYVDGVSLEELIRRERYLPSEVAILIIREACRALAYAHEHGVIHRDIKPGNILISRKGEVKLVDFGIATIHGDDESNLTREGMTLGTPVYMAPEQFQNTRNVDKRADIYSIGVVLYEAVTGKKPFPSSLSPDTLAKIQNGQYERPRKVNPKVSRFAAHIVKRTMKVRTDRRVQNLDWVIRKIDQKLNVDSRNQVTALLAEVVSGAKQPEVPARKPALRASLLAGLAGLLVAVAAYSYFTGYYREIVMPRRYGALEMQIEVPRGGKEPKDLFVAAQLFLDDNNEIPQVDVPPVRFQRREAADTDEAIVFRSQRLHLPVGGYRAKVVVDSRLTWQSFVLDSVSSRSQGRLVLPGDSQTAHLLEIPLSPPPTVPVDVDWRITDRESGRDITRGTAVSVWINGRWQAWGPLVAARVQSGGVYRFSFERQGYLNQVFSLALDPEQTTLFLRVSLPPVPGALIIESSVSGSQLLIDGSKQVRSGGYPGEVTDVPKIGEAPLRLVLPPGRYQIALREGLNTTSPLRIEVPSGHEVPVTIEDSSGESTFSVGTPRLAPGLSQN
jgi:eukaryotic-like serine/threonine-protein kinase